MTLTSKNVDGNTKLHTTSKKVFAEFAGLKLSVNSQENGGGFPILQLSEIIQFNALKFGKILK